MGVLTKKFFTPMEYLKLEEKSETKHEYRDGIVVPMAGSTANHDRLVGRTDLLLRNTLDKKDCEVFTSNMRVQVKASGLYTYPDVTVVCGKVEFAKGRNDTITNPTLIGEVLSASTRTYDRGRKFDLYRALKSLQAYMLIDQEQMRVEYFRKLKDGTWELEEYTQPRDKVKIHALDVALSLADTNTM